jgi:hypothetical protein
VEADIECGAGLVGKNSGVILYSYAEGAARGGGLVRENDGTVRACYATANVSASPDAPSSTISFAGGLVGINCGEISDCYATGAVPANEFARCDSGGLVGRNYVGSASGKIIRSYATGGGGDALAGRVSSYLSIVNCYVLRAADGGGVDTGLGIALTDALMRCQDSFVGWDFAGNDWDGRDEVWMMPSDGGCPVLRGIETPEFAGSGTMDDPFIVEFRYQFWDLWRHPGAHFRLRDDIDLEGQSFRSAVFPTFQGHLDGNGHGILNFTLTGEKDLGLVGVLPSEASIANLSLCGVHLPIGTDVTDLRPTGSGGALVACNRGRVLHCSATVEVTFLARNVRYVGGLIGVNESGEVRGCSVHCAMMDPAAKHLPVEFCGGLIGRNEGIVAECRASSYASGDLIAFGSLVGGNDGTITNSYADGYLYSHHNYGALRGDSFTGGLVGENSGSIANCYASTAVASPLTSGGLVGRDAKGTITSSYFLLAVDDGGPNNGLGIALADAQMRQQASFLGWNFSDVWMMHEDGGYPRLQWEETPRSK